MQVARRHVHQASYEDTAAALGLACRPWYSETDQMPLGGQMRTCDLPPPVHVEDCFPASVDAPATPADRFDSRTSNFTAQLHPLGCGTAQQSPRKRCSAVLQRPEPAPEHVAVLDRLRTGVAAMLQQSVELTEQTSRSLLDLEMMYQDLCDLLQPLPQPAPVPKRARVPAAAADAPAPPPGPQALPFPLQDCGPWGLPDLPLNIPEVKVQRHSGAIPLTTRPSSHKQHMEVAQRQLAGCAGCSLQACSCMLGEGGSAPAWRPGSNSQPLAHLWDQAPVYIAPPHQAPLA